MDKFSLVGLVGLSAAVAGCVPAPPPPWLVSAAGPNVAVRPMRYADVTAGVQRFRVVEPKDWRELNRAVGPRGGSTSTSAQGVGGRR